MFVGYGHYGFTKNEYSYLMECTQSTNTFIRPIRQHSGKIYAEWWNPHTTESILKRLAIAFEKEIGTIEQCPACIAFALDRCSQHEVMYEYEKYKETT
jgi:hypothetical protein